ncbi:MAG: SMC family ATPase [Chloroflexi bacterium]|nr:SMC family ATPase [Chloroflexota bacterium]
MIPLRLQVRNFLSYRDDVPPLLFDGFRLACLSGLNGHGKSALLDAITWALWGKSRARNDDELVHLGRSEMEVQFDFQAGPNVYRVIRKRTFHGGRAAARSTVLLDFQVRDGEQFRSIAGNSARQTEQEIVRRLRLDYDTFVHSAFILQGKADAFTTKPPNERKRILGELLGLALYDDLEQRARERSRELERQEHELEGALADLERQLGERPHWEQERVAAEQAFMLAEAELRAADAELDRLRERSAALEQRGRELAALQQRLERARQHLAADERRLVDLAAGIQQVEAIIAGRAELERKIGRRDALRREVDEQERRRDQRAGLESEAQSLHLAIERAKSVLEKEHAALAERVRTLRQQAAQREPLASAIEAAAAQLRALEADEARLAELRTALADAQARQEQLQRDNQRLNEEGQRLKQQADLLGHAEAACPTCGTALPADRRDQALAHLEAELGTRRAAYQANAEEIKRLAADAEAAGRDVAECERRVKQLAALRERLGGLRDRHQKAEDAAAGLLADEPSLAAVDERLRGGEYAAAERARLAELEAEMAGLAYDPAEHKALRDELAALGDVDRAWAALEQAERAIARDRAEHAALALRLAEQRAELDHEAKRAAELAADVAALDDLRTQVREQDARCQQVAQEARTARDRLAGAQQMLDHLARVERDLGARRAECARVAAERSLYGELADAFSRRGVQAMLIEQVLPELEDEANGLLARLSESNMRVRFETQRATRSGEGTIETLDIRIADDAGTRPYELYSGGEAFRIDFAIRIALSKLLARRAGAQVQMLVIDEGFGTQDERGCERLVEAINAISDDFEKVLVITHVERLKDVFPVRIEVTKTLEAGSQFLVM